MPVDVETVRGRGPHQARPRAGKATLLELGGTSPIRESHVPFGGRAGSSSRAGRVGGNSMLESFTKPKTVVLTLGG